MTEHQTGTHEAEIDNSNRSTTPRTDEFLGYIMSGWAEREEPVPDPSPVAPFAAARRESLGSRFPGDRLVIAAGAMKQRSNDTFYQFRAHSAFSHLTGWGSEAEPGSILVLDPVADGHEATLYFRERAGRDSEEFFANPEIGEFWIGARPSLRQVAAALDLRTADLGAFEATSDDRTLDDAEVARAASELRLVKDEFELREMQLAVDATARGFDEVLEALPRASAAARGERVVEGVFNQRARLDGNTVGYETIAASGAHACTLHWIRNDGDVREGDLLLLDAGVELDSLYTADITRTVPVSGSFSPVQRRVYEAVLEAADAARAIVRPGIRFGDVHDAAMAVIERRTREWGLAPTGDGGEGFAFYRRYMVHGTSHHLGLDVHDCAQARRDMYMDGILEPGMVFTIEPGLYFQPDDLTVPEEFRGIGIRIEDDIVVTEDGCINLSSDIPRTPDDVEEWVRASRRRGASA
ncbi:aminopeptidase P family protein [Leucobacter sp. CSA1]|uniref:Xaa-Pro aminopeptidase n=1 Tax=Leucobacter chromiisoli TaxID=2796471 RepID=A0A934UVI6_9MICO|nr:aminopeptidase P family protein [Leucobacter chromiisoli]MBK0419253.1 aminopeptidase P family protein [Leucobacter chromiisoli]